MAEWGSKINIGAFIISLFLMAFFSFLGHYRSRAIAVMKEAYEETDRKKFIDLVGRLITFQFFFGIHFLYAMRRENPFPGVNPRIDSEPVDYVDCYNFWHEYFFPNMLQSLEKIRSNVAMREALFIAFLCGVVLMFVIDEQLNLALRVIAIVLLVAAIGIDVYTAYKRYERMDENEDLLISLDEKFAILSGVEQEEV